MARRIVFDIRTLADSKGHSDGIVRTLRALARYAARERSDVVFAIFDLEQNRFRAVEDRWLTPILNGAKVDTSHFIDPLGHRRPFRARLPIALRRIVHAVQRPRRRGFVWLEGWRARATAPRPWLDRLQKALLSNKLAAELRAPDGGMRALLPFNLAVGSLLALTPDDVVFVAGFDWAAMHQIAAYVSQPGAPRLAVLCYDIIPLMFPQFYHDRDVARFRASYHAVFPASHLVVTTVQRIRDDVLRYCADHGLALREIAVVPLGADAERAKPAPAIQPLQQHHALRRNGYILFVSTIEPRKNHALLLRIWTRLLAEGIPQKYGFKFVMVGRRGWKSETFLTELESSPAYGDSLLLLSDIDDAMLSQLYEEAAFCVYPSIYEGFGLPIIESFRYGKAVISSNGGALPETVMNFSPCLDPSDDDAWLEMVRSWIVDPAARQPYESLIMEKFAARDWAQASRDVFVAIDHLRSGG